MVFVFFICRHVNKLKQTPNTFSTLMKSNYRSFPLLFLQWSQVYGEPQCLAQGSCSREDACCHQLLHPLTFTVCCSQLYSLWRNCISKIESRELKKKKQYHSIFRKCAVSINICMCSWSLQYSSVLLGWFLQSCPRDVPFLKTLILSLET